jgi:hypothetical protein
VFRRVAQQRRAVAIRDDQPGILWQHLAGKALVDGKIQPVAIIAIKRPFAIDAEIIAAGFRLDDPDAVIGPDRQDVGAPDDGARRSRVAERSLRKAYSPTTSWREPVEDGGAARAGSPFDQFGMRL